jgi:CheY-like chemotaxis protein
MLLLIVDDDRFVLDSLRLLLQLDGHKVVTASSGAAGVAALKAAWRQRETFAAVITDRFMEPMDGAAFAAVVKRINASTRVILLTGEADSIDLDGPRWTNVDHVLKKPLDLEALRGIFAHCAQSQ